MLQPVYAMRAISCLLNAPPTVPRVVEAGTRAAIPPFPERQPTPQYNSRVRTRLGSSSNAP